MLSVEHLCLITVSGLSVQAMINQGAHLERLLEFFEPVNGLHRVKAGHHGPVRLPLDAEAARIRHKCPHVCNQLLLETRLSRQNSRNAKSQILFNRNPSQLLLQQPWFVQEMD